VVGDDINHDLNTGFVECVHHHIKVFKGTNLGVDISVVGNIICTSAAVLCPTFMIVKKEIEGGLTTTILEGRRVERG
jgi:hypothetical protein